MSISTPKVHDLLEQISSKGVSLAHGEGNARNELLSAARALCLELENPVEAIIRIAWAEPALGFAIRAAIDLNLFERLTGDSKSSLELAALTATDPILLGRILKHLSAMRVVREVGDREYASTPLSDALIVLKYRDWIPFCIEVLGPAFLHLPKYLAQNGYGTLENANPSSFQIGHNTSQGFFDWLKAHPKSLKEFDNHMTAYSEQASWLNPGYYPAENLLGKNADKNKDAVLLVDVGGGLGQVVEKFRQRYPSLPGRLILQERPVVIQKVLGKIHRDIEPMEHDYFTPQPVIGARAYYLRSIFHSYPDDRCRDILLNLIPAMKKGYSKILINEIVIPDRNPHWISTGLDLMMLSLFPSGERTEENWRDLLTSVGLKVVKIWTFEEGFPGLIEAELE